MDVRKKIYCSSGVPGAGGPSGAGFSLALSLPLLCPGTPSTAHLSHLPKLSSLGCPSFSSLQAHREGPFVWVCTQRAKFLPHSQTVPFGAPPMHLRRHRVGSLAEWSRVPNPMTGSPMKAGSPRISWPNWMMGWTTPGLEGPLGAVPILKVAQIPISPLSNAHHPALASWPLSTSSSQPAEFYQG